MGDKNKSAKDWVDTDKSTDDLVKDSFESGAADKDWEETGSDQPK
jgi:hypothetical protein